MGHGFHGYVSHNQRPWRFEVRDARLNVPAAIGRKFRIGDVVQDRGWSIFQPCLITGRYAKTDTDITAPQGNLKVLCHFYSFI